MSAFLPESDSEDELPPGWEERATLQGEVGVGTFSTPSTPIISPGLLCKP